jgi:hypothetical protein
VEAWEAVGDDLSCGSGGGFGGLLVGELLGGGGLGLGGCCPYGKIALGRKRQGWLSGGDDEDLFELVEVSRRAKLNEGIRLVIGVGLDGFDGADGKPARIDLIAAGGEDLLADLNAGVGGEIVDHDLAGGATAKNGAEAGGGEKDAGTGGLVVDEKYLRGVGEDVAKLADDAVGRHDSLIGLEAVLRAFVDVKDAREIVAAGADDLSGNGGGDVVLLKVEQGLETVALDGVFRERGLLEAEAGDLLLEVVILLAGVAEVDVVGPAVTEVVAEAVEEPLEGGNGGDSPVAQESDAAAVRGAGFDEASDLDSKADGLGEQNRNQDKNILETCEKRFHALKMIICESGSARRCRGVCGAHFFFLSAMKRISQKGVGGADELVSACQGHFCWKRSGVK